jgi:hypothetical protein
MTSRLLTTWTEHDSAVQEILDLSPKSLLIFDEDLSPLKLENPARIAALNRLLSSRQQGSQLTIVVQKTEFVRQYSPQLMKLLRVYSPTLQIIHAPPQLEARKDSLLIADDKHALLRFHRDHARSRLITDDVQECKPYRKRFDEILGEGGDPISATTLGL